MRVISSKLFTFGNKALSALFCVMIGSALALGQGQSTGADLAGSVIDANDAVVGGATITARNPSTGVARTVVSSSTGSFQMIGLQPGEYEIVAEASGFKRTIVSGVTLTVGQRAELRVRMEVGEQEAIVTVSGDAVELIETTSTTVSNVIDQRRIEALPINERSATGFALTLSTVGRDSGRPIGPAPTSGLNVGGQRGRSTLLQVDGADFTDNSINAARSTVSQEAVQEYQVATNSYAAEFGRATGGIVNVVTKRGTNEFRGNVFGFLRDKAIQARNPFAPYKAAFTRTQYGATLGGPIVKDRAHFFAAFERRQRNESGFFTSDVAQGLTGSITLGAPILPFTQTFANITPAQAAAAQQLISSGNPQLIGAAVQYLYLASSGGHTALNGTNPLLSVGGAITAGSVVGPRFAISGAPVPVGTVNDDGIPIAFRPLNDLQRVFPIYERTNFFSVRGDLNLNSNNQLNLRFGYNPSEMTGIQVESQNQSLGQNDFSRTGRAEFRDTSFSANLVSVLGATTTNDLRLSFGRRNTNFRSQVGDAVAYNISGTAFIGRELFSPVERTETRYQIANNFNWVAGNHTMKFGADFNMVNIPDALFELNFSGLFNFGDFAAGNLGLPASLPAFTPVQSYGLGMPSNFIQGFGNPRSKIENTPIAFFAQDSWKIHPRLTLNYGIRYDVELTKTIDPVAFQDPLSGINLSAADLLAAQDAIGVQQGFPRDTNNWAPRFGFAWDMQGNGKTVVRGAFGLFYDHPLLAVAFNADIADAAQQQQTVMTAGTPIPINTTTGAPTLVNAAMVFHGTICGNQGSNTALCGAFGSPVTPGVASSAQYQFGRQRFNDQTFPGFGSVLPFVLPIAKDFQYGSAVQGNFTVEQQLTKDMALSVGYIFVGAKHLPRPTDLNTPNTAFQIENYTRCYGAFSPTNPAPTSTQPFSTVNPATCTAPGNWVNVIPGMIAINTTTGEGVIAPAIANFFRPSAPNYFLASALSGGAVSKPVLDGALAASNTLRTPGVLSPFGAVNAQLSDGSSTYNALNVELKRRFSNNFLFLTSYTLSHSVDDSSDLQTLLIPQDVNRFRAERANSLFDQRHRFVFSGVISSPQSWRSGSGWQKLFSDFSFAPIIELSSGRPFNIITNVDSNNDQSSQTDRPRVLSDGTLCVPGAPGCGDIFGLNTSGETVFATGNLGRNSGLTRGYASMDFRLTRSIVFTERVRIELIGEAFNVFNRFNEASASPNYQDVNAAGSRLGNGSFRSLSTASYDPRQFQFGFKLHF